MATISFKTRVSSSSEPISSLVVSKLIEEFKKAGGSDELIEALNALFKTADQVRYGGRQVDEAAKKASMEQARVAINEIDGKKLWRKLLD